MGKRQRLREEGGSRKRERREERGGRRETVRPLP